MTDFPSCTLYLIRHGETDWNAEGRLQGGRDIPLNGFGRTQAEEAGRKLRDLVPHAESLDYLCSPMSRARATMEIARRTIGLDPTGYKTDARLRELTFGTWEGMTWREVRAKAPQAAKEREARKWYYAPPDGESYEMLMERTMPVFRELKRDTVIVSHGGVMRVALAGFGFEPKGVAEDLDIWQGKIVIATREGYRWY